MRRFIEATMQVQREQKERAMREDRYLEPWECTWHIIPCHTRDECEELLAQQDEEF